MIDEARRPTALVPDSLRRPGRVRASAASWRSGRYRISASRLTRPGAGFGSTPAAAGTRWTAPIPSRPDGFRWQSPATAGLYLP